MNWKEDLIKRYPEWKFYYESFDLWIEAKQRMDTFDKFRMDVFDKFL